MILRTDSANEEFLKLIELLDKNLSEINGEEQGFFTKYNVLDEIKNVVLYFDEEKAVACGAFKFYENEICEIKRMFVRKDFRNKGIASKVLMELEKWSKEEGYKKAILETSKKQLSAVALYKKNGFSVMNNYGVYEGIEMSICFEKYIK